MSKLSEKDFTYYKDIVKEDEQEHKMKMLKKNMPKNVIAAYEGYIANFDDIQPSDPNKNEYEDAENLIENWLAISADTVIPGLYYQVPVPNIRKKPNGSDFTAEILNGLVRHYFDDKAKKENQRAIMDAYLAYSFGVVKVGYNSRIGILENKTGTFFKGQSGETKDKDMESSVEYVKYERPFVERVSPATTYLDWTKEFGKGQRISFNYDRNLQEIIDSNLYALSSNFLNYFKSKSGDNRKVKLKLHETWIMINGYAHKLAHINDWDHEELAWIKTPYQWLPVSLLRFKEPSDTLYARSHGSLAAAAQKELNYENSIWKEHIDKVRDLLFVDESGLTENGRRMLSTNPIRGIVGCTRPPDNIAHNVGSESMSADIYNNISNLRSYLQQILSTGGSISGDLSAETATQERGVQLGNALRTNGMQDAIRDFNIDQIRKMVTCVVNWGDPEVTVIITGKNIKDPLTGEIVTGKELMIGGERGLNLKELIISNIESDYNYDMDMSQAARPDFAVIRKQMIEYGAFLMQIMPAVQAEGGKINWIKFGKAIGRTFDTIPNAEDIIEEMTDDEKAQMQMAQMAQSAGAETPETPTQDMGAPAEQNIVSGAERVTI